MSGIKTMAEMKQIAKNQSETIKQQNEILANQAKDIQMKAQQLEMERIRFEASRNADIHHQVNQCVDFAIRSLPWWNRSVKSVVNRSTEYLFTIRKEVAKHVAMEVMAQKIHDESVQLTKEQAEDEKIIAAGIPDTMDREGAELETK